MSNPSLYMIHVKLEQGFDDARAKAVRDDLARRVSIIARYNWSKGWRSDDGGSTTMFASSYLDAQSLSKQLEGQNLDRRSFEKEDIEVLTGSALCQNDSILVFKLGDDFATRHFGADLTRVHDWIQNQKRP